MGIKRKCLSKSALKLCLCKWRQMKRWKCCQQTANARLHTVSSRSRRKKIGHNPFKASQRHGGRSREEEEVELYGKCAVSCKHVPFHASSHNDGTTLCQTPIYKSLTTLSICVYAFVRVCVCGMYVCV